MLDLETTSRIADPHSHTPGTISVRVLFTKDLLGSVSVYGVFRLDDDSEIDFCTLDLASQNTIESACEEFVRSMTENRIKPM